MNLLLILAWQFLCLSFIAIGGASATLPEMHRVFVDNLHLMTDAEFSNLYAISQAAPGPNVLFVGLFGWQMAGLVGSLVSLLAMCGPTSLMAIGVEHYGSRHQDSFWYAVLRKGLMPLSIGLLTSTSLLLMQSFPNPWLLLLTVSTVGVLLKFRLNLLWLIGVGAALGVIFRL